MLKHKKTLELFSKNNHGHTDHILNPDDRYPRNYRSDCWCEARQVYCKDLKLFGKKYKGVWKVILHEGRWYKPTFAPSNKINTLYKSLQEPPEGGWDRVMAEESVDDLLDAVNKYQHKETKLVQKKNESMLDYYSRVRKAIEAGITEIQFETNDPEAFHELLKRDDDFELEIDEEE